MIRFQDINPEVMDLPSLGIHDGRKSSGAVDDIVNNIVFYIQSNRSIYGDDATNEGKDENELLSIYMDEYFNTDRGRLDYEIVDNIASKLGRKFLDAYNILSDEISSDVTFLNDQIQEEINRRTNLLNGYEDINKLKFDYVDLSSFNDLSKLAYNLCKKYKYDVNILKSLNIGGLYKRLLEPKTITVSEDTLKSVLGEITITIKNDNEDAEDPNIKVNTDSNIDTNVNVNGEDKTDDVSDNGGGSSDSSDSDTDHTTENQIDDTNVDVNTPNDVNDNVTVTINGQKVNKAFLDDNQSSSDTSEDDIAKQDEEAKAELRKLIVEAAFNSNSFKKLYNKFLNMNTSVSNKALQLAAWFVKFPINKLYNLKTSLSDTNREILESNLESLEDLQRLVAVNIYITMQGKEDVVVITPRMLNLPAVQDAKNKGIDIYTWVRDYLRVYHNTNTKDSIYSYTQHAPVTFGITLDKLITSRPVVESMISKYKNTSKLKEKEAYLGILKESFIRVLNRYIDKIIKIDPGHIPSVYKDPTNFKKVSVESIYSLANQLTNNDLSNVEDTLYSFYFMFWYRDTLVEKIYKDTSYHLQLGLHNAGTESLDSQKESNIRAKVMSDIVISLLKELF